MVSHAIQRVPHVSERLPPDAVPFVHRMYVRRSPVGNTKATTAAPKAPAILRIVIPEFLTFGVFPLLRRWRHLPPTPPYLRLPVRHAGLVTPSLRR
jgi:hypothetical protein